MRIVLGVTGASAVRLSIVFAKEASKLGVELHTVISKNAYRVFKYEEPDGIEKLKKYSKTVYEEDMLEAPISSSSFKTDGMVILPCSMNTVAKLTVGISDNLLLRAADIQIKMGNKLIIVPRESPLSRIHLRNLYRLSRLNNVYILFPLLTYYHEPKTINDMELFTVGKILDILGVKHNIYKRWRNEE